MKNKFNLILYFLGILIFSCSKKPVTPVNTTTVTGSTLDLIKDSIYLYPAEDYLWYQSLPTYTNFQPRSFTGATDIAALQKEMDALSQYAINPATSKPYEYSSSSPGSAKYSFVDDGTVGTSLGGTNGDFGIGVLYNQVNDLRIKYVYPGSPAGLAGLRRGYKITAINNNTNISYDASGYGTGTSTNLNYVINAIFQSNNITLTLKKPDSTSITLSLNTTSYTVNPILKDTIYNIGNGHIIGYLVFNSFTDLSNSQAGLTAAISDFAAKGVTDLAIDLRYNGGGSVATAEYFDNLIVPPAKSGTLMYNTYYSANMVSGNDPLLHHQIYKDPNTGKIYYFDQFDYSVAGNAVNFSKVGSLSVNRVFFIISGSTASASELTINNLYPEMDVQLIGRTSYGKPVGFFGLNINKYVLYTPEFSVKNSLGKGDYYAGFSPGTTGYPGINDYDDPTKDFGDPTEALLAHVLHYVNTGSYSVANLAPSANLRSRSLLMQKTELSPMGNRVDNFRGMVFDKSHKKLK